MNKTNTIGIDLAKNVFHQCTQNTTGHNLSKTKLGRSQFKNYLATTAISKIVFEANCSNMVSPFHKESVGYDINYQAYWKMPRMN